MKTPTLEEVKEYFKNAEEVKCLSDGLIYSFENMNKNGIHEYYNSFWFSIKDNIDVKIWDCEYSKIISYKDDIKQTAKLQSVNELQTPNHYDNSKGTLYKVATERNWNPYLFDIVKRLERAEKKGEFKTDLEKSINVIKLWLQEYEVKN